MNKPIVSRLLMLSGLLLATSLPTYAAISSKIESTALTKAIAHSVIDKNGTVMVAQGAAEDNTNQIARLAFKRTAGKNEAEFAGIAANASAIKNKAISALSLSPSGLPVAAQEDFKVAALTGIKDATKAPLATAVALKDANSTNVDRPITAVVSTGDYLLAAVNGASKDNFGDANSGLALVRVDQADVTKLAQIKYDGDTAATAFKVDVMGTTGAAAGLVGLSGTTAAEPQATSAACMCYDEHLDVAYLGVGHLKTAGANGAAAVALVLAELVDAEAAAPGMKQIKAYPAMSSAKENDDKWSTLVAQKSIGAHKNNADPQVELGVTHVATMHTSTGRDYLVVVDRTGDGTFDVNAVLVMPKDIAADNKSGLMAYPADATGATTILDGTDKIDRSKPIHIAGNNMKFLQHDIKPAIGALRVVGDTVYISVQGARNNVGGNNEEAGIFSSRAIFNKYGAIIAWTPWERAYGFIDDASAKIGTFEVDRRTGQITSVVATTGQKTITETWTGNATERLPKILSEQFNDGIGVLGMFNFDADTPAFKRRDVPTSAGNKAKLQEYSLMVATGFGKVALIETGQKGTGTKMVPTVKYELTGTAAADKPVHMFNADGSDAALAALGPIITADLARVGAADSGYLFVGGKGGVAVLRNNKTDADAGKGWNADKTSGAKVMSDIVGTAGSLLTFAQMKDATSKDPLFTNTRKIIATQKYVFIMTDKGLYRVEIAAATFANGKIESLNANTDYKTLITDLHKVTVDADAPFNSSDELYDMMLSSNKENEGVLLVATSQGVFVVGSSTKGVNAADPSTAPWARVKDTATAPQDFICGPAFKFELVSAATGGLFTTNGVDFKMDQPWLGNVYVTALDKACKNLNVYRLAVGAGTATLIKEPYLTDVTAKTSTEHFYTIGSYDKFARPAYFASEYDFQPQAVDFANHGVAGDFTVSELIPNPALFVQKQPINLNLDISSGLQLAQTVHDATGGITYAYGQFGVRALE